LIESLVVISDCWRQESEARAIERDLHEEEAWKDDLYLVDQRADDPYATIEDRLTAVGIQLAATQRDNIMYQARREALSPGGNDGLAQQNADLEVKVKAMFFEVQEVQRENQKLVDENGKLAESNEHLRVLLSLSEEPGALEPPP